MPNTSAAAVAALTERIDALLPQTHCGQCNFPGCGPYAEAIAGGAADINQCPPGGEPTIQALAELLGREFKPLNLAHGITIPRAVAVIDEQICIGCFKCIQACPVDAILGAAKLMHTVIADECTGCELCVAPCPVDCIQMIPLETAAPGWSLPAANPDQRRKANRARQRFSARQKRLERLEAARVKALHEWQNRLPSAFAEARAQADKTKPLPS